jgi:hypothetical protein
MKWGHHENILWRKIHIYNYRVRQCKLSVGAYFWNLIFNDYAYGDRGFPKLISWISFLSYKLFTLNLPIFSSQFDNDVYFKNINDKKAVEPIRKNNPTINIFKIKWWTSAPSISIGTAIIFFNKIISGFVRQRRIADYMYLIEYFYIERFNPSNLSIIERK